MLPPLSRGVWIMYRPTDHSGYARDHAAQSAATSCRVKWFRFPLDFIFVSSERSLRTYCVVFTKKNLIGKEHFRKHSGLWAVGKGGAVDEERCQVTAATND